MSTGKMYRLSVKVCDTEEKLREQLDEEQLELLRKFNEAQDKQHMAEVDEALLYGFRFGVSLINELRQIKKVDWNKKETICIRWYFNNINIRNIAELLIAISP